MKNQTFFKRFQFAWSGIRTTFGSETSFRQQLLAAMGAYSLLIITHAQMFWWVAFTMVIVLVLALELVNTALEILIDRLHPEQHESIKKTKDCLAGAVLVACFGALILLGSYLYTFAKLD